MHRQEEYKGHSITVHTFKRGEGFGWSYQIDGGPVRESRDRPLRDEETMLKEAIDQAKAEIHGL
jgi:hypothetical protein